MAVTDSEFHAWPVVTGRQRLAASLTDQSFGRASQTTKAARAVVSLTVRRREMSVKGHVVVRSTLIVGVGSASIEGDRVGRC
jgi:hypothetical protein